MSNSIAVSLERIDELTVQGDLIGAWRLLDADELGQSGHSGVLVARARLLGLRGRHVEARVLLEQRLLDSPSDSAVQVELARIALHFGEAEVAHAWYERAYRDDARGEGWVLDWVDLLCRLKRLEVAQSVMLAYCECTPASANGWFVLGLTYQLQSQHDLALSAYDRALQLDATIPMLRNNLAASYIETRMLKRNRCWSRHFAKGRPTRLLGLISLPSCCATLILRPRRWPRSAPACWHQTICSRCKYARTFTRNSRSGTALLRSSSAG
jgi:tetratricopeptide (TPR) repeat protein